MLSRIRYCNVTNLSRKFYGTLELKTNQDEIFSAKNSPPKQVELPSSCLLDEVIKESNEKNRKKTWKDILRNIQTVEEKIIKINMPKYYGYATVKLEDSRTPYNALNMVKHYTNTSFEEVDNLPEFYNQFVVDDVCKQITSEIVDSIEFSNEYFKFQSKKKSSKQTLDEVTVQQINQCLLKHLSKNFQHLSELEIDIRPRHEAFWWTGGIQPTKNIRKSLEGREYTKLKANQPTFRAIQYTGKPFLSLRHSLSLKPFTEVSNINNANIDSLIPIYEYDPRTLGYSIEYRHGTIIPGYWPGNVNEFGFLNYQHRNNSIEINKLIPLTAEILREAMHIKGIQSSFAWLFAQACYQGFSNFEDVTFPFVTQTVVTNGQLWSFYGYQLNTTLPRHDNFINNEKINRCWGTKEMKLYEHLDENGKCIGFNEEVLKTLIKLYANQPTIKQSKKIQRISDIKEEERREFLEKIYKHLMSNRPRNRLVPEIYMWEKIYKIDHKTRPLESKRRFFELGVNPFKRQLDHHKPVYIPRDLRPDGYKSRKRWAKTYYP
ncbi:39S ribosomal protein S30, mitochondrial [Condylostylus longicornis]|uniref:39S ribosomal protein S30, mitochondrial n=1 Tax=Condylostylus longicornis TaxID=2530218 RepID=UPI00244D9ED4|nr:39S ribosomal protein S30, mitochondrial [Condylostylus longicornis]